MRSGLRRARRAPRDQGRRAKRRHPPACGMRRGGTEDAAPQTVESGPEASKVVLRPRQTALRGRHASTVPRARDHDRDGSGNERADVAAASASPMQRIGNTRSGMGTRSSRDSRAMPSLLRGSSGGRHRSSPRRPKGSVVSSASRDLLVGRAGGAPAGERDAATAALTHGGTYDRPGICVHLEGRSVPALAQLRGVGRPLARRRASRIIWFA